MWLSISEVAAPLLKSVLRAEEMNGVYPEEEVNALESAPIIIPTGPI
ncbi:hypothetical protein OP10G_3595 [Fimbriimonas ginsengisoli Gsoil 348]|uniref:Uncharacterized protein n=1 Tax=Fimbriimonas ginsengisoli Gsoil 348 TaxID=661478 RepID=A0A068NTU8_FIMGI|nr:hypothetical protein OP10G_3595 [Fimbriimonas ginsengisoli Gsoil 348]